MRYSAALALFALSIIGATPASAADPSFSCTARDPTACHFRIFYAARGGRVVVVPGGKTLTVPGLTVGKDHYCVTAGRSPTAKCRQKVVSAQLNS